MLWQGLAGTCDVANGKRQLRENCNLGASVGQLIRTRRSAKPRTINCQQSSGRRQVNPAKESLRRSSRCSNLSIEITGAIHRLQLPASKKDHARTQTAAIGDPMPDLRWVHRIKQPGRSRIRNGSYAVGDLQSLFGPTRPLRGRSGPRSNSASGEILCKINIV